MSRGVHKSSGFQQGQEFLISTLVRSSTLREFVGDVVVADLYPEALLVFAVVSAVQLINDLTCKRQHGPIAVNRVEELNMLADSPVVRTENDVLDFATLEIKHLTDDVLCLVKERPNGFGNIHLSTQHGILHRECQGLQHSLVHVVKLFLRVGVV